MNKQLDKEGIIAIIFTPNSRAIFKNITNIYQEDADYIRNNDLNLTLEELTTGEFALYLAKNGCQDSEEEICELASNRTCEDSIHSLVEMFKNCKVFEL